jgi:hypothetical protein
MTGVTESEDRGNSLKTGEQSEDREESEDRGNILKRGEQFEDRRNSLKTRGTV